MPQVHPDQSAEPRSHVAGPLGGTGPSLAQEGGLPSLPHGLSGWLGGPVLAEASTSLGHLTAHLGFLICTVGLCKDLKFQAGTVHPTHVPFLCPTAPRVGKAWQEESCPQGPARTGGRWSQPQLKWSRGSQQGAVEADMTAAPTTPTSSVEHPAITLVCSAWALSRDPRLEGHWQGPLSSAPGIPTQCAH